MSIFDTDMTSAASRVANSLTSHSISGAKPAAASAAAASGSASSSTATNGAQITSSDFLTLLVTEMKNQDPTQPTDPNAYIQQLVGVNSLQQLIAINQDLSGLNGSSSGASASSISTNPIAASNL